MPVFRLNATPSGVVSHPGHPGALPLLRDHEMQAEPTVILVHGYKYAPGSPRHCPHRKIFSLQAHGWPKALGLAGAPEASGLAIALGWYARGPLRAVFDRAEGLGMTIARLVLALRRARPQSPVHIVAHSLGVHAALSALPHLPVEAISRMILLSGASLQSHAARALATPAGRTCEILNVTSRENDLFDLLFERLIGGTGPQDRAIGQGIDAANAVNLQLDCARTLNILRSMGLTIGAPQRRICHWSSYTRPGVMELYKRFLFDAQLLTLRELSAVLPKTAAPRWSHLLGLPPKLRGPFSADLPHPPFPVSSCGLSEALGPWRSEPHDTAT